MTAPIIPTPTSGPPMRPNVFALSGAMSGAEGRVATISVQSMVSEAMTVTALSTCSARSQSENATGRNPTISR